MIKRLYSDALGQSLKTLAPLYLLVGADPLLATESEDAIAKTATEQGFEEKFRFHLDNQTDWQAIFDETQAMGLFSSRKIFILHAPENLTQGLQKNFVQLMQHWHEDLCVIIHLPKLSKAQEKQQWFSQLTQGETVLVQCQTPTVEYFPHYVKNRCQQMGLPLETEALQTLCYNYEGNLLALKQALNLLQLLYDKKMVTLSQVQQVVEQSSVFTVYQWTDALLVGNFQRSLQILEGLKQEEIVPIILLRTLQKELMTLLQLTETEGMIAIDQPLPTQQLHATFDKYRIWQNRRDLYRHYIQRSTPRMLFKTIQSLADLEREAKQTFSDNLWHGLTRLSQQICQA